MTTRRTTDETLTLGSTTVRNGPRRLMLTAAGLGVAATVALPTAAMAAAPLFGGRLSPAATTAASATSLSAQEQQDLLFMRQEEKLAADVYAALYELWGLPVFTTINASELNHQTQVAGVMAAYGMDDPVAGLAAGEFLDPDLQALYGELVARGSTSVTEALEVGAYIEELDIDDLRTRPTTELTVANLYSRLEQASQNHLRAFVSTLERYGESYDPVVLDAGDFDEIISGETTAGRSQQRWSQQNRSAQGRSTAARSWARGTKHPAVEPGRPGRGVALRLHLPSEG